MAALAWGNAASPAAAAPLLAQPIRNDATPDDRARAIAQLVGGLIGYARWPEPRGTLTICTMGATRMSGRLREAGEVVHQTVTVREIPPGSGAGQQDCDVLYLGGMAAALRQRAIMAIHGRPVLSVTEDDPDCRSGAMFCLIDRGDAPSFRLNLDAVSRGTVRVDPRVLRLFTDDGGGS